MLVSEWTKQSANAKAVFIIKEIEDEEEDDNEGTIFVCHWKGEKHVILIICF